MIHDPEDLPSPGGIYSLVVTPYTDTANISWMTANEALGQVYFRPKKISGSIIIGLPEEIYVPLMFGELPPQEWSASPLDKTPKTNHAATLSGLVPGRTYEFIVVSRGLSGDSCTTWTSGLQNFSTSE
jgi:hypothetical protein